MWQKLPTEIAIKAVILHLVMWIVAILIHAMVNRLPHQLLHCRLLQQVLPLLHLVMKILNIIDSVAFQLRSKKSGWIRFLGIFSGAWSKHFPEFWKNWQPSDVYQIFRKVLIGNICSIWTEFLHRISGSFHMESVVRRKSSFKLIPFQVMSKRLNSHGNNHDSLGAWFCCLNVCGHIKASR